MLRVCIHLVVHDHVVYKGICCELLSMAYNYVAQKIMKTSTARNCAMVMATNKQFLSNYLLETPSNCKGHHSAGLSLEVVMDIFIILTSPDCHNFVSSRRVLFVVEWV